MQPKLPMAEASCLVSWVGMLASRSSQYVRIHLRQCCSTVSVGKVDRSQPTCVIQSTRTE